MQIACCAVNLLTKYDALKYRNSKNLPFITNNSNFENKSINTNDSALFNEGLIWTEIQSNCIDEQMVDHDTRILTHKKFSEILN